MSLLPEETRDRQAERQARIMVGRDALKYVQAEAQSMSRLTADPLWEKYGRHLENKVINHTGAVDAMEYRLKNAFLGMQEYGDVKVKHSYNQGVVDGLNFALNIAKELIEKGEKAAEELAAFDK